MEEMDRDIIRDLNALSGIKPAIPQFIPQLTIGPPRKLKVKWSIDIADDAFTTGIRKLDIRSRLMGIKP